MSIGKKIKELRTQKSMTQTEVAKALNTTCQTIFKYEQEIVTNIPTDKIEQLAKLFEVSPAYLIGWSESNENEKPMMQVTPLEKALLEKFRRLSAERQELAIQLLAPLEGGQ